MTKNQTSIAPLAQPTLVAEGWKFHTFSTSASFASPAGLPAKDALTKAAELIEQSAVLMDMVAQENGCDRELGGIRFLLDAAWGLINGAALGLSKQAEAPEATR